MAQGYSGGTYNVETGTYTGGTAGAGVSTAIGYTDPSSTRYIGSAKTNTYITSKKLPKKEYMTYEQAGIPKEEQTKEPTISLKNIFTSTPTQRQTFVRETQDYNKKVEEYNRNIQEAKTKVDEYNKQVKEYNKNRTIKQAFSVTTIPEYTVTTSSETGMSKQTVIDKYFGIQKQQFNLLTSFSTKPNSGMIIGKFEKGLPKQERFTTSGKLSDFKQTLENWSSELSYKQKETPNALKSSLYSGGRLLIGGGQGIIDLIQFTQKPFASAQIASKTPRNKGESTIEYFKRIKEISDKEYSIYQGYEPGYTLGTASYTKPQLAYTEFLRRPEEIVGATVSTAVVLGGIESAYYKWSAPKTISKPIISVKTREIKTPKFLKGKTAESTVSLTNFKTVAPKIESVKGLGVVNVSDIQFTKTGRPVPIIKTYISGKQYSFKPILTKAKFGSKSGVNRYRPFGEPDNLLTGSEPAGLKQLPAPKKYTKTDLTPMVIEDKSIVKYTPEYDYGFKGYRRFQEKQGVSGLPATIQEIPEVRFTEFIGKGKYNIKYVSKGKFNINEIDISAVYKPTDIFRGGKLKKGQLYHKSIDLTTGKKTEFISIPEELVPENYISKTKEGMVVVPKFKSERVELVNRFIGKTGEVKFYGVEYKFKTPTGTQNIDETLRIAGLRERPLLSQVSEGYRLYPPALPAPKEAIVPEYPTINLQGYTKLDRKLEYLNKLDKFKPLTESEILKTTKSESSILNIPTYSVLESGLTQKQILKYKNILSTPTAKLVIEEPKTVSELINKSVTDSKSQTKSISKLVSTPTSNGMVMQQAVYEKVKIKPKLDNINIPITKTKIDIYNKTRLGVSTKLDNMQGVMSSRATQTQKLLDTKVLRYTAPKTKPDLRQGLATGLGLQSLTITGMITDTINTQESTQLNINEPTFKFKTPIIPKFGGGFGGGIIIPIPRPGEPKKKTDTTSSYDVFVLDKGKWIRANKTNDNYNYYGALKLGSDIADNSSARSFKVKPGTGKVNNYYPYKPSLAKFYQPSKTGKPKLTTAYIEKTKYLIDTQGERQQITAKGIIASRRKSMGVFRL